jgi:hypothetical protein
VDACSRLDSFARAESASDNDEVLARQETLATDELVVFSLHARRLISDARVEKIAASEVIPTIGLDVSREIYSFPKNGKSVSVADVYNAIIHHRQLDIIRNSSQIVRFAAFARTRKPPTIKDYVNHKTLWYAPKLWVRPNKPGIVAVELVDLIDIFLSRVLSPLVDRCADDGLFLERAPLEDL